MYLGLTVSIHKSSFVSFIFFYLLFEFILYFDRFFLMRIGVILRCLASTYQSEEFQEAYMDVLVVSTIVCYMRLMNVFAFSKSLVVPPPNSFILFFVPLSD